MSERIERMITEAIQAKRPVLVNPTDDEIRRVADELRHDGKLFCMVCREPIHEEAYLSQRISVGAKVEAVVHLHLNCASGPM